MTIRTPGERLPKFAGSKLGGILAATPVCVWLTGTTVATSAGLVVVLTLATMLWAPLFITVFDRVE